MKAKYTKGLASLLIPSLILGSPFASAYVAITHHYGPFALMTNTIRSAVTWTVGDMQGYPFFVHISQTTCTSPPELVGPHTYVDGFEPSMPYGWYLFFTNPASGSCYMDTWHIMSSEPMEWGTGGTLDDHQISTSTWILRL